MRVLVYDGDCALCEAASRALVAWGGVPDERRRSHLRFEGEAFERLRAARFHDELAVLDESTGEIRSGVAGILWWLRDTRLGGLARALDRPAVRAVLSPLYRLVAYNRRVIAPPPPRPIPCACDPSPHPAYQATFAALLGAGGVVGTAAVAAAATSALLDRPLSVEDAPRVLLAPAVALALAAIVALRAPGGRRLAALGHALWPLALASTPFLVGAAASLLLPAPAGGVGLLAGLVTGLALLAVSAARRRRILASWRR